MNKTLSRLLSWNDEDDDFLQLDEDEEDDIMSKDHYAMSNRQMNVQWNKSIPCSLNDIHKVIHFSLYSQIVVDSNVTLIDLVRETSSLKDRLPMVHTFPAVNFNESAASKSNTISNFIIQDKYWINYADGSNENIGINRVDEKRRFDNDKQQLLIQWQSSLQNLLDQLINRKMESFYIVDAFQMNYQPSSFENTEHIERTANFMFYDCNFDKASSNPQLQCRIIGASRAFIQRMNHMEIPYKLYEVRKYGSSSNVSTDALFKAKSQQALFEKVLIINGEYDVRQVVHLLQEQVFSLVFKSSNKVSANQVHSHNNFHFNSLVEGVSLPFLLSDCPFANSVSLTPRVKPIVCKPNGAAESLRSELEIWSQQILDDLRAERNDDPQMLVVPEKSPRQGLDINASKCKVKLFGVFTRAALSNITRLFDEIARNNLNYETTSSELHGFEHLSALKNKPRQPWKTSLELDSTGIPVEESTQQSKEITSLLSTKAQQKQRQSLEPPKDVKPKKPLFLNPLSFLTAVNVSNVQISRDNGKVERENTIAQKQEDIIPSIKQNISETQRSNILEEIVPSSDVLSMKLMPLSKDLHGFALQVEMNSVDSKESEEISLSHYLPIDLYIGKDITLKSMRADGSREIEVKEDFVNQYVCKS